ncbi:sugar ABC transporter permease [Phycicoccus sp. Soil803]|uniref:ABC transporter permease n=1 Tax=Phycicoccus sp. Soil803 TaxID=1736415 RepID=UPI000AD8018E|nr:ABC transporter permease subunit [Phycicoccus sp. Soil803]
MTLASPPQTPQGIATAEGADTLALMRFRKGRRNASEGRGQRWSRRDRLSILLLALPAIVLLVVFAYLPMAGLVVAFKEFNIVDGVFRSPWAGLENFRFFFSSGDAVRVLFNTVFLNVLFLGSTLVVGLGLAIMLNELRSKYLRRPLQSVIFFPYFVSPIVVSVILQVLLAGVGGSGGAVNKMLGVFSLPEVSWYTQPGPWPWILTIVKIWQMGGYTSVIFLAAITSIPEEVYEAGALDGCSRARMALHITTPLLRPTVGILVILGVGRIFFGDFGTIYAIVGDNGTLFPTTDVIDTYVFRALRTQGDFGTTAAIGLFQSLVGFVLISVATLLARRYSSDSSII